MTIDYDWLKLMQIRSRTRPRLRGHVAAASMLAMMLPAVASVPLPQSRPADAPARASTMDDKTAPPAAEAPKPPEPSACRLALTEAIAIAPTLPPIHGPGACGGDDIVRLEAVVLPDARRVPLKPAATLRCAMAAEIAAWVRTDLTTLAAGLGTAVGELDNFDSFDCRGRNRVAGARMSEHGRANALDVRGVRLLNGQSIALTDRATPRELREKVLWSVCARFTTVLGPGSDGYHEDHIHLDLSERRSGYRICQWDVWDQMAKVAPLMPAVRPDEAPPRPKPAEDGPSPAPAPSSDSGKTPEAAAGEQIAEPGKAGSVRAAKPRAAKAAERTDAPRRTARKKSAGQPALFFNPLRPSLRN